MRRLATLAALPLFATLVAGACTLDPAPVPPSRTACRVDAIAAKMTAFSAADVAVHLETDGDPGLEIARADVAKILGALWGGAFPVRAEAPDLSARATVWISRSAAAASKAGLDADGAYAIRRVDDGSAHTVVVVAAHDAAGLAHGAYALLEQLGARFFHPEEDFVPRFDGPRIPEKLDLRRAPAMASRGLQLHTLHPIEYLAAFTEPSAENLAAAKRMVDWLVRTGQNHLQWVLLSTVDFDAWKPHAQAIVDYAHQRGVTVGAAVQVWGGASLQNNYVLVHDEDKWQEQMDAALDRLFEIGWDSVDLALGEFVSAGPQAVIDWLDHAVEHLAATQPAAQVNVQNHVGNYANLWVEYQGEKVFYYHLPQFADARLGQAVHTLAFFDVYRDWATYGHPDFHLQHDYLMKMLPSRRVSYFPESAYWISADDDVPLFLPTYLYARWNDIHGLVADAKAAGLPPIGGHLMFSSGHEWGYWLTDYLAAKMLFRPDEPLQTFLDDYAGAFGSCAADVGETLGRLVDLQNRVLFDGRLMAYVQGENTTVDFGYLAGKETHPKRIAFEEVLGMSEADRAGFRSDVVEKLEAMVKEMAPMEDDLGERCEGADEVIVPWCAELLDGIAIVRNRAAHAAHLYRSILASAEKKDPEADYQKATELTAEAAKIVARREEHYRFPVERLTGAYPNATVYPFGYLRPAHSQCYWRRREQQVRELLDYGAPASLSSLPACMGE